MTGSSTISEKNGNLLRPRQFIITVGLILLFTALIKLVSAFGSARLLATDDPIFGISFKSLMIYSGAIELVVAGLCLLTRKTRLSLLVTTWLATLFIMYHYGLAYIHWHKSCPCLGNLTDLLHIPPQFAEVLLTSISFYFLIGSVFYLFFNKCGLRNGD